MKGDFLQGQQQRQQARRAREQKYLDMHDRLCTLTGQELSLLKEEQVDSLIYERKDDPRRVEMLLKYQAGIDAKLHQAKQDGYMTMEHIHKSMDDQYREIYEASLRKMTPGMRVAMEFFRIEQDAAVRIASDPDQRLEAIELSTRTFLRDIYQDLKTLQHDSREGTKAYCGSINKLQSLIDRF